MNDLERKIREWSNSTQDIADLFVQRYYPDSEADCVWLDEIGGIYRVGEQWWTFENIITALNLDAKSEKLSLYYDYDMAKCLNGESPDVRLKEFLNMDDNGRSNILGKLQGTNKEEFKKMLRELFGSILKEV